MLRSLTTPDPDIYAINGLRHHQPAGIPFPRIYAPTLGGHGLRPGGYPHFNSPAVVIAVAIAVAIAFPFVDGGWGEMKVAVENITGRFLYVEVEQEAAEEGGGGGGGGATVGRLKTGIASEEAVQEQRMILVTQGGRVMADDGAALSQYGVREGSLVYLYFFPDGTTKWPRSAYDYLCVDTGEDADGTAAS